MTLPPSIIRLRGCLILQSLLKRQRLGNIWLISSPFTLRLPRALGYLACLPIRPVSLNRISPLLYLDATLASLPFACRTFRYCLAYALLPFSIYQTQRYFFSQLSLRPDPCRGTRKSRTRVSIPSLRFHPRILGSLFSSQHSWALPFRALILSSDQLKLFA